MRISQVLSTKPSSSVITIRPDATVRELVAQLAAHNVGALIVSTGGTSVEGIVSERDVVRYLHENNATLDSAVSGIMTADVHTCTGEHDVNDLMQVMTTQRIRHVPVVDGDTLIGIISIGDVVKHRMSELQFERDQLNSYVHSSQS
jgi:CBS domain-containing protein